MEVTGDEYVDSNSIIGYSFSVQFVLGLRGRGIMTNLLEKMQWLYEQGFVPDRWKLPGDINHLTSCNKEIDICGTYVLKLTEPYFTESMLWSLIDSKPIWEGAKPIEVKTTLLEALLDLTIWAVKQGYLKPEVKG